MAAATNAKNTLSLEAKARQIPNLDKLLSFFTGGIGLKHICEGLSRGNLTLDTILKFDTKLGKYLSFNSLFFKLPGIQDKSQEYVKSLIRCNIIYFVVISNIDTLINSLRAKYKIILENYNNLINTIREIENEKRILENEYRKLNNNTKKIVSFKEYQLNITEYDEELKTYTKQLKDIEMQMIYEFTFIYNPISATTFKKLPIDFEIIKNLFINLSEINPNELEGMQEFMIENRSYNSILHLLKIFHNKLLKWINNWYENYDTSYILSDEKLSIHIILGLLNYNLLISSPILEDLFEYKIINHIIICKETNTITTESEFFEE